MYSAVLDKSSAVRKNVIKKEFAREVFRLWSGNGMWFCVEGFYEG